MIEIIHLTKKFGDLVAVDDLNLKVNKGELFGIIGPNGAGKTTVVRILCGALRPTSGTIRVMGYDVVEEPIKVKRHIGYLAEEPNLYERMTPFKLLKFFGELYGMNSFERIEELLDMVGLLDRAHSKISTFSKGMRERLAIARALLHDPEILVLDEPTMGLDPGTARTIREFIAGQKKHKTILMCTHYLEEAEILCDRIGIMNNGRLVALGTPKELKEKIGTNTLEDVFVHFVR
jgi:ABC-2 type transport system ATP-binding protein